MAGHLFGDRRELQLTRPSRDTLCRMAKRTASDVAAYKKALKLHQAEGKILRALKPLTQRGRDRVLRFFADRVAEEAGK